MTPSVRRTICSALAVVVLSAIQGSATALPGDPLAIEASLDYRDAPNAAALVLYSYKLQYTVDPRRITFALETQGGKPVRGGNIVVEGVTTERVDPQPHVYSGSAVPGSRFVNFHLDARGLSPGMYRVVPAFHGPIGQDDAGRPVRVAQLHNADIAFAIPPAPDSRPARTLGAEYYFDEDAARVNGPAIGRIVAVRGDGSGRRYDFTTESQWPDRVAQITLSDADFASPSILPIVSDANERSARAAYEGHTVWGFGRFELACGKRGYETPPFTALRIRRIVRVLGTSPTLHVGEQSVGILGAGFAFTTVAPLVVFFDGPHDMQFPGETSASKCVLWRMLGDAWQLDVTYSPSSPHQAHPEWSDATLADIAKGRVRPGMTHAMVAWALGFPNTFGTRAELMRASTWTYDAPPPARSHVDFRGDRVMSYDPPRMLP
jgi:hypothetical protein